MVVMVVVVAVIVLVVLVVINRWVGVDVCIYMYVCMHVGQVN